MVEPEARNRGSLPFVTGSSGIPSNEGVLCNSSQVVMAQAFPFFFPPSPVFFIFLLPFPPSPSCASSSLPISFASLRVASVFLGEKKKKRNWSWHEFEKRAVTRRREYKNRLRLA